MEREREGEEEMEGRGMERWREREREKKRWKDVGGRDGERERNGEFVIEYNQLKK